MLVRPAGCIDGFAKGRKWGGPKKEEFLYTSIY